MNEFKLIVAGGRDFSDKALLDKTLMGLCIAGALAPFNVSIVSGMARGADALGAQFARENGVKLYEYVANWDKHGKRAGFIRNEVMGKAADGLLAFHDGASKGTAHMIQWMSVMGKHVVVVNY